MTDVAGEVRMIMGSKFSRQRVEGSMKSAAKKGVERVM